MGAWRVLQEPKKVRIPRQGSQCGMQGGRQGAHKACQGAAPYHPSGGVYRPCPLSLAPTLLRAREVGVPRPRKSNAIMLWKLSLKPWAGGRAGGQAGVGRSGAERCGAHGQHSGCEQVHAATQLRSTLSSAQLCISFSASCRTCRERQSMHPSPAAKDEHPLVPEWRQRLPHADVLLRQARDTGRKPLYHFTAATSCHLNSCCCTPVRPQQQTVQGEACLPLSPHLPTWQTESPPKPTHTPTPPPSMLPTPHAPLHCHAPPRSTHIPQPYTNSPAPPETFNKHSPTLTPTATPPPGPASSAARAARWGWRPGGT